jgi:hypothetical protein
MRTPLDVLAGGQEGNALSKTRKRLVQNKALSKSLPRLDSEVI